MCRKGKAAPRVCASLPSVFGSSLHTRRRLERKAKVPCQREVSRKNNATAPRRASRACRTRKQRSRRPAPFRGPQTANDPDDLPSKAKRAAVLVPARVTTRVSADIAQNTVVWLGSKQDLGGGWLCWVAHHARTPPRTRRVRATNVWASLPVGIHCDVAVRPTDPQRVCAVFCRARRTEMRHARERRARRRWPVVGHVLRGL